MPCNNNTFVHRTRRIYDDRENEDDGFEIGQ